MKFNKTPYSEAEAKDTAKALLAATDYAMLPDVLIENREVFEGYRAYLRFVTQDPTMPVFFDDIPEPIWTVLVEE
jgi:hypothetical protein